MSDVSVEIPVHVALCDVQGQSREEIAKNALQNTREQIDEVFQSQLPSNGVEAIQTGSAPVICTIDSVDQKETSQASYEATPYEPSRLCCSQDTARSHSIFSLAAKIAAVFESGSFSEKVDWDDLQEPIEALTCVIGTDYVKALALVDELNHEGEESLQVFNDIVIAEMPDPGSPETFLYRVVSPNESKDRAPVVFKDRNDAIKAALEIRHAIHSQSGYSRFCRYILRFKEDGCYEMPDDPVFIDDPIS